MDWEKLGRLWLVGFLVAVLFAVAVIGVTFLNLGLLLTTGSLLGSWYLLILLLLGAVLLPIIYGLIAKAIVEWLFNGL